jgi:hypothetical protein
LKKPSASKDSPPELSYFIDRDLGRYLLPNALESAGLRVERYATHFNDLTHDDEWLPKVGMEGWVALSHDRNISRDSLLVAASMRAGVRLFILRGKSTTGELARNFLLIENRVRLMVARNPGAFIAKIYMARDSSRKACREAVQMYMTIEEWRSRYGAP